MPLLYRQPHVRGAKLYLLAQFLVVTLTSDHRFASVLCPQPRLACHGQTATASTPSCSAQHARNGRTWPENGSLDLVSDGSVLDLKMKDPRRKVTKRLPVSAVTGHRSRYGRSQCPMGTPSSGIPSGVAKGARQNGHVTAQKRPKKVLHYRQFFLGP